MQRSPYEPPNATVKGKTELAEFGSSQIALQAKEIKRIKSAWIAGLIISAVKIVLLLSTLAGLPLVQGVDIYSLIDISFILGLSFGIFRNSRICAVGLSLYFAYVLAAGGTRGSFVALLPTMVVLFFLIRGSIATFRYHSRLKNVG